MSCTTWTCCNSNLISSNNYFSISFVTHLTALQPEFGLSTPNDERLVTGVVPVIRPHTAGADFADMERGTGHSSPSNAVIKRDGGGIDEPPALVAEGAEGKPDEVRLAVVFLPPPLAVAAGSEPRGGGGAGLEAEGDPGEEQEGGEEDGDGVGLLEEVDDGRVREGASLGQDGGGRRRLRALQADSGRAAGRGVRGPPRVRHRDGLRWTGVQSRGDMGRTRFSVGAVQ